MKRQNLVEILKQKTTGISVKKIIDMKFQNKTKGAVS